jgi:hypothetical protein
VCVFLLPFFFSSGPTYQVVDEDGRAEAAVAADRLRDLLGELLDLGEDGHGGEKSRDDEREKIK